MAPLDCCAMAIAGHFDVFDRATGVIEYIEELLAEQEIPTQLHVPTAMNPDMPTHIFDLKAECQADLVRAKEMIAEACRIAQNVVAKM